MNAVDMSQDRYLKPSEGEFKLSAAHAASLYGIGSCICGTLLIIPDS
jgi:hypothetical protein